LSIKIPSSSTSVKADKYVSRNGNPIIGIVVHNALGPSNGVLNVLKEGSNRVSYHWIIFPSGEIESLVDENMAAFHIGFSSNKNGWTNRSTIGVAVSGKSPLSSPEQTASLYALLANICKRRQISVDSILSHNTLNPNKNEVFEDQMRTIREQVGKILYNLAEDSNVQNLIPKSLNSDTEN
jgi:N-acetyl-anhydromuramyl-L-alanine amidase AmpD